ncbi:AAA family ATPase [Flavobacteriaceae bacterium]|nr:AAA family ATPase [Flavobacteriaceae bacterium]
MEKLDIDNLEFNIAANFIKETNTSFYLTGKAGTGKTTFLKYITKNTDKSTVVLAPTGVAAINAGGETIHSFFQIPFGPFIPGDSRLRTSPKGTALKESIYTSFKYTMDKRKIIENMELLIIDEISMVRADVLDVIDRLLRVFRGKKEVPFGGVQLVLIGDTFQLPPVVSEEQWSILSEFYKTPFFFSARSIKRNLPVYIELKKIYRQQDQEFIDLLNRVRIAQTTAQDLKVLNAKVVINESAEQDDAVILATHNYIVDNTNSVELQKLTTEESIFEATITGVFPDKQKPTDQAIGLKIGAQVMFVKNDSSGEKKYYNGKIGKVIAFEESEIVIGFENDTQVTIGKEKWTNIKYTYDKKNQKITEEEIGTFEQFPIRLAWAITVHKSQGLTFNKVIVDLNEAFAPGQTYVALSRCTSFEGLSLKSPIDGIGIATDKFVMAFSNYESDKNRIDTEMATGRAAFLYQQAYKKFKGGKAKLAYGLFKKAYSYRDTKEISSFKQFVFYQESLLLGISVDEDFYEEDALQLLFILKMESIENLDSQVSLF